MEPDETVPGKLPEKVGNKTYPEYTLPKPDDGDIWANCLKPLLEEDKQQCDVWRDEVQNLLLFAGLFSAVVTTFVVDSYKNLLPSPDQRTVDLLSQILTRLDNSSTSFDQPPSLSPSPSSIRINTLWFMSLVLSLTTVLVGIVSLQWIREYERYSGHWTPEVIFIVRNMRHESMNKWFVPQIFTGLPLLLQAALILFFAGLIDFLLHLYPRAAIPAIIIITATLFFLALTTALPVLQYYTTYRIQRLDMPTTPSPYKSPQSWVFLRTTELIRKFLLFCKIWVADQIRGSRFPSRHLELQWRFRFLADWDAFDSNWVCNRSQQVAGFSLGRTHHYDTAFGVARFIVKYCQSNKALTLSAYHCFLEQHKSSGHGVRHWRRRSQSHFYRCLGADVPWERPIPFFHGDFNQLPDSESLRQDVSLMIFLSSSAKDAFRRCGMEAMITGQKMELLIRMSSHFGESDLLDSCLVSEAQWLYQALVRATVDATADCVLWQPVAVGIAEVTAAMSLSSTPASVKSKGTIQHAHNDLAKKILESGMDRDARLSGPSHKLGYNFVEHIFRGQNGQISLPEWPEEYMESFIFLTHAICETMDKYPETDHSPIIASRMNEFLSEISPELRGRVSKRYPIFSEEPNNTSPLENPPTDESIPQSIPNLDHTLISPATPPRVILPPQTPTCDTNVESTNQPGI